MNEKNEFRVVSANTAYRKISKENGILTSGQNMNRQRFTLGDITSANIVMDVNVGNGWTRIRLKEVPRFLVNAFNMITKHGIEIDGIFRKEGNSARLNRIEVQNIYRGNVDIPNDYTIIDICTLVKRFLRDLKPPLLNSEEFCCRLLKKACQARISNSFQLTREEMADMFYFGDMKDDAALLPEVHFSTLAYVMRQLLMISLHHEKHKMSIENLSLVLVGSVFGDRMHDPKKMNQGRRCSQDDILARKKQDMNVHVSAIKLLITNANLIGVRKDPYIASNAMVRSSSAMPTMRCMSSGYETSSSDPEVASSSNGLTPNKNENMLGGTPSQHRRDSEAVHKIVTARKKSESSNKKKRSSSFLPSLRDIKSRFTNIKRAKSPSPERMNSGHTVDQPPATSGGYTVFNDNMEVVGSRQKKVTRAVSNTNSTGSTASGRQSRSQHSRRANTNAVSRSSTNSSRNTRPSLAKVFDPPALPPNSAGPLRRLSQSEQNTEVIRIANYQLSNEKITATEFLMQDYSTPKLARETRKTVVLGGIDHFAQMSTNLATTVRKSNRNRRHTAPVNNGLRRHRPNTIGAGLPQRRATLLGASSMEEKENQHHNSDTEDSLYNTANDREASEALLEQKAMEARSRRANRKQRVKNVSSESMNVLNGSNVESTSSIVHVEKENGQCKNKIGESPQKVGLKKVFIDDCSSSVTASETEGSAISTPPTVIKKVAEMKKKTLCDMATSPVVFDSPRISKIENGHAWVGVKQTVVSTLSPNLARRHSRTRVSYSKANEMQLEMPSSIGKDTPLLSPMLKHVKQVNNSPPLNVYTASPVVLMSSPRNSMSPKMHHVSPLVLTNNVSFASVAPPVPPHSPPQLTPQTSKVSVSKEKRPPTPPSNPQMSNPLSPKLARSSIKPLSIPMMEEPARGAPGMFKLPQLPGMKKLAPSSPLARQPQSLASFMSLAPNLTNRSNLRETKSIESENLSASTHSLKSNGPMSASYHGRSGSPDDFGFGKFNDVVKSANNPMALPMSSSHQCVGSRPSVAVIRQNFNGLVRSRVNQYQEIEQQKAAARINESAMSGRVSSMSQASLRSNDTDRLSDYSDRMVGGVDSGSRNAISSDSSESAGITPTRFSYDPMQRF